MEIVSVNHGVKLETAPITTLLYRDGKCERVYYYTINFVTLNQNYRNLTKNSKLSESKTERSHGAYARVAIIS